MAGMKGGLEPASSIISLLGGPKRVAQEIKIHRTRVSKWKLPKESGGTGGSIPPRHIPNLMRFAIREKIDLRYSAFFPDEPELDLDWIDPGDSGLDHLAPDGFTVCHCVKIKQDESCPVGFPSALCDDCDGKGFYQIGKAEVAA